MLSHDIVIVGAGLSGLYAAYLLEKKGVHDYLILEAQERLGGRLHSALLPLTGPAPTDLKLSNANRFDQGAAWLWPAMQPGLAALVAELDLTMLPQFEEGDMVFERALHEAPMRTQGYTTSPPSMRLVGGMSSLIEALQRCIPTERIQVGRQVVSLQVEEDRVLLIAKDAGGSELIINAKRVLLAIPPRLAAETLTFDPPLPKQLARDWRDTLTWMAPHAKYFAVYDHPFWRDQGLSGEARSVAGPLAEVHDASAFGGDAALFGFLGISAEARQKFPEESLRSLCRAQLVRLFGSEAANPKAEFLTDWASQPFTATHLDQRSMGQHGVAPRSSAVSGAWANRLAGIASEWSPYFSGYVAGAVDAAERAVSTWLPQSETRSRRELERSAAQ